MAGQQDQTSPDARGAARTVEKAWEALPAAHRDLLIEVGASQWTIVEAPLGLPIHKLLRSAGSAGLSAARIKDTDAAVAVWLPTLRIVVFNAHHPALTGLSDRAFSHALAQTAWHEWGHALSIARCSDDDVRAGDRLLQLAPTTVAKVIRDARYRHYEYTHELVANVYAALGRAQPTQNVGKTPMATSRDLRPRKEGDRVDGLITTGYRLPPNYTFEDLFNDHADLLRSEGIDPTWRDFKEASEKS